MKLDVLVLAAHPDDAELSCSGTILSHIDQGKKVGIVDLTRGEMGTRGTPEIRMQEAEASSKILGLSARENLGLEDVHFTVDKEHKLEVVKMIRKYQPEIILANAISDRHPDHAKGAKLASEANFMAGLKMIETTSDDGIEQDAWKAKVIYHYVQNNYIVPDLVVDISPYWEKKLASIKAFKSQFYDPNSTEPESFISSAEFLEFIEARAKEYGHSIGVKYGEGFTVERNIGVSNLFDLI
ncbi:bacillithiol biosynthesis deacetylase BshB1 [Fulvivirgaceae bacterium BMA10]|uniref:Bacillithiol biosynthesis deacetylase BshB1 n=1 Tax=Splendidivirga corallicola TaxID=3051826 RepID=A0ABT8KXN0_9BACT|nr:bacillithiol biosynthesis deacetylase BshB1 [Fulvivirgaceae bacterium BMA10]